MEVRLDYMEIDPQTGECHIYTQVEPWPPVIKIKSVFDTVIGVTSNNEIYVEYDAVAISLKLLKMEILLYLDIMNTPSIVSFDKHTKNNKEDIIIIKDLCCEYCLKGMIEELLEIDGIESAYSDFDYTDKINVKIFITYDDKLVNKDIIKKLEKKFNS